MKKVLLLCWTLICALSIPAGLFSQDSDVTPPSLESISIPSTIDTTSGPQPMIIVARITDDLSGFDRLTIDVKSPSGNQTQQWIIGGWSLSSGTPNDGIFRYFYIFPQFTESGTWVISSAIIRDLAGNYAKLTTEQLQALGVATSFQVISNPDTLKPTLTQVVFVPEVLDVSSGSRTLKIRLSIADDLSGFDYDSYARSSSTFMTIKPPSSQLIPSVYDQISQISGVRQNGVFEVTFTIPRYAEEGEWRIGTLFLYDKSGNLRVYGDPYTGQAPEPWPDGVQRTFTVASNPRDTSAPEINGFSFAPSFINTSEGDKNVTVTLRATDDLAGIRPYEMLGGKFGRWYRTYGLVAFQSPSGGQFRYQYLFLADHMKSGTPTDGVWQMTINFPQYSEAGTWRVVAVSLMDDAGNSRYLYSGDLAAAGFPSEITVIQPSLVTDGIINGSAGGRAQDSTFGELAQIEAPPGVLGSGSVDVSIDVLSQPPEVPSPQGFSVAGSRFVNIELTPKPTGPLPAPGLTLTIPLVQWNPPAPGTKLKLFRINSSSGTLVPALGADGFPIEGTVNPDGLTATFTGIISFSTVVALVPGDEIPGDLNGDGSVDCADLAVVKAAFGKRQGTSGYDYRADVNRNKVVDIRDLTYVSRLLLAGTSCTVK